TGREVVAGAGRLHARVETILRKRAGNPWLQIRCRVVDAARKARGNVRECGDGAGGADARRILRVGPYIANLPSAARGPISAAVGGECGMNVDGRLRVVENGIGKSKVSVQRRRRVAVLTVLRTTPRDQ